MAGVMPEHHAWTLVLQLPLIAITLGKSHPYDGSQFLNLSNGSGGLGDGRVLLVQVPEDSALCTVLVLRHKAVLVPEITLDIEGLHMGHAGPIAPKQHLVILKWEGTDRAIVCGRVGTRHTIGREFLTILSSLRR